MAPQPDQSIASGSLTGISAILGGTLFEQLPVGLAAFDRACRLLSCNPVWRATVCSTISPTAECAEVGRSCFELAPELEPILRPLFERALAGETVRVEDLRLVVNGHQRFWDILAAPAYENGQVAGLLNVIADVTTRLQALDRLELVMLASNDGIWDWNIQTGETYYAPRWKSMLGYQDDELENSFETWRRLVHPDDLAAAEEAIRGVLETKASHYQLEHRLRHRDGSYRWMLARGILLSDAEGSPLRLVGAHTDITESKTNQQVMQTQIAFENLVTTISTQFINLPHNAVDEGIQRALEMLGKFAVVDRAYVFQFSEDEKTFSNTHEWCAEGIPPQRDLLQNLPVEMLAWSNRRLLRGELIFGPRLADLPDEAAAEKELLSRQGVRSFITVPMTFQNRVLGFLGFDTVRTEKDWNERSITLLKITGEILVNAIEHKRTQAALQAYQRDLERRVEERTAELERRRVVAASLGDTLKALNSNLPLADVLTYICQQARQLMDASAVMIRQADQEQNMVRTIASSNLPAGMDVIAVTPLYMSESDRALFNHQPVVDSDLTRSMGRVLSDPRLSAQLDDLTRAGFKATLAHFRSQVKVPLFTREGIFGSLTFLFDHAHDFNAEEISLATSFGDQASLAIENARLYLAEQNRRHEADRRREVAEQLREMLTILNSQRPLSEVLDKIVGLAEQLLHADAVAIFRLQPDEPVLEIQSARNLSEDYQRAVTIPVGKGAAGRAVETRSPVVVEDAEAFFREVVEENIGEERRKNILWASARYKSLLAVPMVGAGLQGAISLYYKQPHQFSDEEVALAASFADQAALAVETARLREQAGLTAATAERNRLARDLHDAVTQTLFSASLIAEVLPRLLENKPAEAQRRLDELRLLTRGALAEMRTLLVELRPTSLVEADLGELLRQLSEAFTGRSRIPVVLKVNRPVQLPADVQVAFYRISQEALNNISKHAQAGKVTIRLTSGPRAVTLAVRDNGRGFDPQKVTSEHFGLKIMRERAESVGAQFEITTAPGRGAQIKARWKIAQNKDSDHE